jgi:hypothetical protein
VVSRAELDAWVHAPGLPDFAVLPQSEAFAPIDAARAAFVAGRLAAADLPAQAWTPFEWLHFLDNLPARPDLAQLAALDARFGLTAAGNAEIAHSWLRVAIRAGYEPARPRLVEYLTTIGRRKLIKPLYEDLMRTPQGARFAREIYAQARPGYHPIVTATLDPIVVPAGTTPPL